MVADQLAAAAGEDGRSARETRPVLLAAAGGEPSNAAALRVDATADRVAALASPVAEPRHDGVSRTRDGMKAKVSQTQVERGPSRCLVLSREAAIGRLRGPWKLLRGKSDSRLHSTGHQVYKVDRAGVR